MKPLLVIAFYLFAVCPLVAKPPGATTRDNGKPSSPSPTPGSPAEPGAGVGLARWLALTPSGADAIALPFAEIVSAATGRRVVPFDAANAADAAALARAGAALDAILPRMNRPDSPAHAAAGMQAVAARFEDELRGTLLSPPTTAGSDTVAHGYPAWTWTDPATGKAYYFAVALYPTGGDPAATALTFSPGDAAARMTADGCCLLVGIEHNGKPGHDLAFLNWQVLDLAKVKVRFAPVFQATAQEALQPGAVLTDGRKGRD